MAGLAGRFSPSSSSRRSASCSTAPRIRRDARLQLPEAARAAAGRQEGPRGRRRPSKKRLQLQSQKLEHQLVKLDTQARQALAAG